LVDTKLIYLGPQSQPEFGQSVRTPCPKIATGDIMTLVSGIPLKSHQITPFAVTLALYAVTTISATSIVLMKDAPGML